jgi:tRNA1Val (adenine37-N6)-methyltransferase
MNEYFHFKQFSVSHKRSSMKVGTDGVLLGAWVDVQNTKRILDVGTGTGVIALMLAQRTTPGTRIDAVELSDEACLDAAENFANSPWREKITLHHMSVQSFSPKHQFDLIVSNPPYFINSYKPADKMRHQARHTDSLSFLELLQTSSKWLTPDGRLAVILPAHEGATFLSLTRNFSLHCIRQWMFRSRQHKPVERLLFEFSGQPNPLEARELCLYEDNGDQWTEEYVAITRDFYLNI